MSFWSNNGSRRCNNHFKFIPHTRNGRSSQTHCIVGCISNSVGLLHLTPNIVAHPSFRAYWKFAYCALDTYCNNSTSMQILLYQTKPINERWLFKTYNDWNGSFHSHSWRRQYSTNVSAIKEQWRPQIQIIKAHSIIIDKQYKSHLRENDLFLFHWKITNVNFSLCCSFIQELGMENGGVDH